VPLRKPTAAENFETMSNQRDTIFALSSGRAPAAIAVVRVSGPRAGDAMVALGGRLPQPRHATLLRLKRRCGPKRLEPIDDAVVLWFPGPRSETGEDIAEFHLHGGHAVIAAVLTALGEVDGLRLAEPGEFTRRAFANGKLDLTRVEGLADLIGAETEAQRRQAFRQLKGLLGDRAEQWRQRLTQALAMVEALIDFAEEDVVSDKLIEPALAIAKDLEREIRGVLADCGRGERLREGLTVAVAGPVNVGKSTIVNRLAKRSAAIVSPFAGTTRDIIEVHLDLGGYPVTVLDTAGLRDTGDPVEQEGVRRALARAGAADLVLWVMDATLSDQLPPPSALARPGAPPLWMLANKSDLAGCKSREHAPNGRTGSTCCRVSALTGEFFDELEEGLAAFASRFFAGGGEGGLVTRQRHRAVLGECADALARAGREGESRREDIIAEELRLAARALGRLVGRVDVENVLDVIFRDFCIGK
jgi:tRNA modification GTPase